MALARYEKSEHESAWASRELVEKCKKIKALPGRVAVLVNLEKQTETWKEGVLVTDKSQALRDRLELPPYLLRSATVISDDSLEQRFIHPNEGQWWSALECRDVLGIDLPNNWQIRLIQTEFLYFKKKRQDMIKTLLGTRVSVKPDPHNDKTESGIILPDSAQKQITTGTVTHVGVGDWDSPVNLGDRVIFGKYGGTEVTIDKEEYIVMDIDNVYAIIND